MEREKRGEGGGEQAPSSRSGRLCAHLSFYDETTDREPEVDVGYGLEFLSWWDDMHGRGGRHRVYTHQDRWESTMHGAHARTNRRIYEPVGVGDEWASAGMWAGMWDVRDGMGMRIWVWECTGNIVESHDD
jgi:hypothetical protein